MPYSHDYWLTDLHGAVRGARVRAEYDDDALATLRRRILDGSTGPLAGVISVVREDGDVIDSWDGPAQVALA